MHTAEEPSAHRKCALVIDDDERARYLVTDVTFLRSDVALAHKRAWAVDADGRDIDVGHAMVALYVFVRTPEGWRVAARKTTLVSG